MDPALEGLGDVLLGSLLAVIGLTALAVSPYRRRGIDPLLASFGVFALLYGLRLVVGNPLTPALGIPSPVAAWISSLTTYLILVPAWFLFWKLLGNGWHSMILWWLRVVTVFAVVGIASDLAQGTPGTLARHPNNVIVILGLIVAALGFRSYRGRMTSDLWILVTGLSVFALLAINDNLVSMRILPWTWQNESVGFTVFVGCLGWIAMRRYAATERNLANVEGELEAARKIQSSILPERSPDIAGLDIAYCFEPSSTVAGDFFEFLELDQDRLGIVVADVSGHGVPAALIASMVKVAIESSRVSAEQPAELLTRVNQTLCGSFQHGFVTAVYLFLDLARKKVILASAGHPLPLLQRASDGSVAEVGGRAAILGRFPEAEYRQETFPLAAGDRILLYTDGVFEARNAQGEMFGEERLHRIMAASASLDAAGLCDAVVGAVGRWTGAGSRSSHDDDFTLVAVDYQPL